MILLWREFKEAVLPWLLAALVVGFLEFRHSQETKKWVEIQRMHAASVLQQGEALLGIHQLLSEQGYVSAPFVLTPNSK